MPFLDDDKNEEYYSDDGLSHFESKRKSGFDFSNKKFYLIGGGAAVVAFSLIVAYIYNGTKPVDLGELPVIQAEDTPIKVKAENNQQVDHQDKLVYDNISGNSRVLKERIAPKPEEPLDDYQTVPSDYDVLSPEETENIIREFDELAPKKRQQISETEKKELGDIRKKIVTTERPPINNVEKKIISQLNKQKKNKKNKLNSKTESIVEKISKSPKGTVMVQVASVGSKSAAEAEYKRIIRKNPFLKNAGKRIARVDLGSKGIKYRLQIGPFEDKKKATKAISLMKNNGFFGYISK